MSQFQLCDGLLQTLGNNFNPLKLYRRQYDREFLAAVASNQIAGALHTVLKCLRNLTQTFITADVPIVVIKQFEMIQIDHDQADIAALSLSSAPLRIQELIQITAISHTG